MIVLYHWSPVERRAVIRRRGLRLRQRPTCSTDFRADHISAGPDPATAWSLSAGVHAEPGDEWDCWQIRPDLATEIHARPFWAGEGLQEYRIMDPIPPSRLWLVGTRTRGRTRR